MGETTGGRFTFQPFIVKLSSDLKSLTVVRPILACVLKIATSLYFPRKYLKTLMIEKSFRLTEKKDPGTESGSNQKVLSRNQLV